MLVKKEKTICFSAENMIQYYVEKYDITAKRYEDLLC